MANKKRNSKKENQKLINIVLAIVLILTLILVFRPDEEPITVISDTGSAVTVSDITFVKDEFEIITTESGLQYQDWVVGDGAVAQAGQTVVVHYTGYLTDGTKFDSSVDRGTPFEFPLGARRVILGWDEGVDGMKIGSTRLLIIPAALGYGDAGAGGGLIPPGATLVFEVSLLEIK